MRSWLPQDCLLCATRAGAQPVCAGCRAALPHHPRLACPQCALPTSGGERCGACLKKAPAFDATLAAFDYRFPLDALLHAYKYGGRLALADFLAGSLVHAVGSRERPDLVLPMPLHPASLRQRGFNQSAEIARIVARRLSLPIALEGCVKVRQTPPQASLPWRQRQSNVRGAFACELDLRGSRVAVVDDVMTTGATLNELGKVLKKRGAAQVSAWVVARTLPGEYRGRTSV